MKMDAKDIDALLPQTQCGQCHYKGCMPYAIAIAKQGERINQCVPGGINTLHKIAALVQQSVTKSDIDELLARQKPNVIARINEDQCIGCTKCISACPVDAILGSSKRMHTVIRDECTGCQLCVEPCPVDCIELIEVNNDISWSVEQQKTKVRRERYYQREKRLTLRALEKQNKHNKAKNADQETIHKPEDVMSARKNYIAAAVKRAKMKMKLKVETK